MKIMATRIMWPLNWIIVWKHQFCSEIPANGNQEPALQKCQPLANLAPIESPSKWSVCYFSEIQYKAWILNLAHSIPMESKAQSN